MITVWGRATSSNVQLVMWAIGELGLAHERIDVGGNFGGTDAPDYRRMNPNGLVPTMRDGDLVLWESAACLRYLAARYGDAAFWPPDPADRAPLDMWAEWSKTTFGPAFNGAVFWPLVRVRAADRDMAAVARAVEALKPVAGRLDARIGTGPWLGGDRFSFADVMAGHLLYRYFTLDFDRAETPGLAAYYARLRERPAFATHAMVSYESLRIA